VVEFFRGKGQKLRNYKWKSSGVNRDFMEFFRGKYFFVKFFRGKPIFLRKSSGGNTF